MKHIAAILLLVFLQAAHADVPAEQKAEVDHLLKFVSQSDCIMLRNGSEHVGEKAVSHIQKKYDYFRDDINSTESFIEFSATKSTMSGKYYTVRCPGKQEMRSQDWLLEELAAFRTNTNNAGAPPSAQ